MAKATFFMPTEPEFFQAAIDKVREEKVDTALRIVGIIYQEDEPTVCEVEYDTDVPNDLFLAGRYAFVHFYNKHKERLKHLHYRTPVE